MSGAASVSDAILIARALVALHAAIAAQVVVPGGENTEAMIELNKAAGVIDELITSLDSKASS